MRRAISPLHTTTHTQAHVPSPLPHQLWAPLCELQRHRGTHPASHHSYGPRVEVELHDEALDIIAHYLSVVSAVGGPRGIPMACMHGAFLVCNGAWSAQELRAYWVSTQEDKINARVRPAVFICWSFGDIPHAAPSPRRSIAMALYPRSPSLAEMGAHISAASAISCSNSTTSVPLPHSR